MKRRAAFHPDLNTTCSRLDARHQLEKAVQTWREWRQAQLDAIEDGDSPAQLGRNMLSLRQATQREYGFSAWERELERQDAEAGGAA